MEPLIINNASTEEGLEIFTKEIKNRIEFLKKKYPSSNVKVNFEDLDKTQFSFTIF